MAFAKKKDTEISVIQFSQERLTVRVTGVTPIILCRMSQKAKHELLLPKVQANRAAKAATLKHDPHAEFAVAPYRLAPGSPTLLAHLATAFKSAIRNCAVDMPGASKAQIGRMLYVEGEFVPLFGIPQLHMSIVRNSGMSRTPDVRTRCILPEWAATLSVVYMRPILTAENVMHLIAGAGLMQGVGDWRPEKGSSTYGQFRIVDSSDAADVERWERVVRDGGYAAQLEAMDSPEAYDDETHELLAWFGSEVKRRQLKVVAS